LASILILKGKILCSYPKNSIGIVDWLSARPEIDRDRMVVVGRSFGSLFGTLVAANEPRLRGHVHLSRAGLPHYI
jgi:dienelactone hydrolase